MKKVLRTTNPCAWIVSTKDRGRKSIKNGVVYLKNNEEFEIELFNPLSKNVLADIKIDGKSISTGGLIVKSGQRVYLDCFVDSRKKLTFKTYEVDVLEDGVTDAISKNGHFEVLFYEEEDYNIFLNSHTNYGYYGNTLSFNKNLYTTNISNNISGCISTNSLNYSDSNFSDIKLNIETGQTEGGKKSNQEFEYANMNFKKYILNRVIYRLLPDSRKPVEIETKKNNKSSDFEQIIRKLKNLYDDDIITKEEYDYKKKEVLDKI
jgi:hypothetical protein